MIYHYILFIETHPNLWLIGLISPYSHPFTGLCDPIELWIVDAHADNVHRRAFPPPGYHAPKRPAAEKSVIIAVAQSKGISSND
jgi:hypothetical protein